MLFIPGLVVTLFGLFYVEKRKGRESAQTQHKESDRPTRAEHYALYRTLAFICIFSAPFSIGYLLAFVLFSDTFQSFVQLTSFGFILSVLAGFSYGVKYHLYQKVGPSE